MNEVFQKSPYNAKVFYDLGESYLKINEIQNAIAYFKKCYDIRKELYDDNHPQLAEVLESLGECYHKLDDFQTALEYKRMSYEMKQKIYDKNHPDIADTMVRLC